jgi:hypothetical protein
METARAISSNAGRPDPDNPLPPGPWDPVIRQAAENLFGPDPIPWQVERYGPFPEPWRAFGRIEDVVRGRFDRVALNPQPLPPRWAFSLAFARAAMERLILIQETAETMRSEGDDRSIIVVGGKVSELVEFVCGNSFRRPIPGPGPRDEMRATGDELVMIGLEFLRGAKETANTDLANEFRNAGRRLVDEGVNRF